MNVNNRMHYLSGRDFVAAQGVCRWLAGVVFLLACGGAMADTTQRVFLPTDDAYVKSEKPKKNYGAKEVLRIRAEEYRTYVKFIIAGLEQAPESAILRLYATDGSPDGGAVYATGNSYQSGAEPWKQSKITWKNAPPSNGKAIARQKDVADRSWVEFDVSDVVVGNGMYSFVIKSSVSNSAYYSSLEGERPPELIVR